MLRHAPEAGGILEEALDPDLLSRFPPCMIAEYPGTDRAELLRSRDGATEDPETDPARQESLEKLRSLGYIR